MLRAAHGQAGREGASGGTSTTRDGQADRDAPRGGPSSIGPGPDEGHSGMDGWAPCPYPGWERWRWTPGETGQRGWGLRRVPRGFPPAPALGRARSTSPRVPPAPPPIPELSVQPGGRHPPNHLLLSSSKALS